MRYILGILFTLHSLISVGQINSVLTYNEYMELVKENHPVMYQSRLLDDMAESNKLMARGGFDPKLEADWNHKSYDEKNYYSLTSGAVKIPTWYGIDLKAGYNHNNGQFLNDSDIIPTRGLWNVGISVPLGKGLVIDNRRAQLKKAEIFQSSTDQEQVIIINDLIYDAATAYLEWQVSKAYYDIALEGQNIASIRFESTRTSYINGDKPAIDTLESLISLQNRQLELQKATQEFENKSLAINNFLWLQGVTPLELEAGTIPEDINLDQFKNVTDSLALLQNQWLASHPELLLYDYKVGNIEIDQRLAKEEIKPDIRLNYNPLVGVAEDAIFDQFSPSNFKVGATVSYPILQRKQRGKIQINKIKIQDTEYKKTLKQQNLSVKLKTYLNNINQAQNQYKLLDVTLKNYEGMLRAENRKFQIGESSVFLVNSRENKYLESRYKSISYSQKLVFNRLTYLLIAAKLGEI